VLQARWREIVGETLARRTEPVRVIKSRTGEGGTLELRVDGPVASLIQHQARRSPSASTCCWARER
jgi:hypothetical protein